ncbi:hypothetical protein [Streptomyces sp. NRRL F-5126]|uniref:hypothetical protein n=1 Tax=Streptomyces sp. NRRL F-5126 TaxID=1463857 RepID=UPI00068B330E|nr:hypothetical protein [Streptomyces sp. NRRL F-5126]
MDPFGIFGFAVTVLGLGMRALLGWPYGAAGLVGLALLLFGARTRRRQAACAGAVVLALVLVAPGS